MVSLISLARTPREKQDMVSKEPRAEDIDDYAWGLSVTLDDAAIRKLGLGSKDLKAGDELVVAGQTMVVNTSIEMENGIPKKTLTIQFQKMAVVPEAPPNEAERIYGGKVAKS